MSDSNPTNQTQEATYTVRDDLVKRMLAAKRISDYDSYYEYRRVLESLDKIAEQPK